MVTAIPEAVFEFSPELWMVMRTFAKNQTKMWNRYNSFCSKVTKCFFLVSYFCFFHRKFSFSEFLVLILLLAQNISAFFPPLHVAGLTLEGQDTLGEPKHWKALRGNASVTRVNTKVQWSEADTGWLRIKIVLRCFDD